MLFPPFIFIAVLGLTAWLLYRRVHEYKHINDPSPTAALSLRAALEPCAKVSSAIASYTSTTSGDAEIRIPADIAFECLRSVPFHSGPALELVAALKPFLELQSTLDILKNPPSGYLYNAIDLLGQLDVIKEKVGAGSYSGEYDFQLDVLNMLNAAKDGHLVMFGDLLILFGWKRMDHALVAVSVDGLSLPKIYSLGDITPQASDPSNHPDVDISRISSIAKINGVNAQTWLNTDANTGSYQDPDANWNDLFTGFRKLALGSLGSFNSPLVYPGTNTRIAYENGTQHIIDTIASVRAWDVNINSGEDVYRKFCGVPTGTDLRKPPPTTASRLSQSATSPDVKSLLYYPTPEIIDPSGIISGYFLDGPDTEDVAVLVIVAFTPLDDRAEDDAFFDGFQKTLEYFLASATSRGKERLVIDMQGNPGGSIDLAVDTYAQLFPQSSLNTKTNLRASLGLELVARAAARYVDSAEDKSEIAGIDAEEAAIPFAYQSVMTPSVQNFKDFDEFYGPYHLGQANYSNFLQLNYTNDDPTEIGRAGITITGTNNRTGFRQPFAPENVVLLTDGLCASSCSILAELLKNGQSVRQITMGGRSQIGPMQAVGGVKGSQSFPEPNLRNVLAFFWASDLNLHMDEIKGTPWEKFSYLPHIRSNKVLGVNGRNHYRLGDTTETALQFVYEAADARIWYTPDMIASPLAVWEKVAKIAFPDNSNATYADSPFVILGSTKHPTSVSGGLKRGAIGPQTPPTNAKAVSGQLVNGRILVQGSGL